jgi:acyl carrier protein
MTAGPAPVATAASSIADDALIAVVAEEVGLAPGDIRPNQAFARDFGLDSLDFIKLIMAVEQALQIKIDDKDAARIRMVEDLLRVARAAPADPDIGTAA